MINCTNGLFGIRSPAFTTAAIWMKSWQKRSRVRAGPGSTLGGIMVDLDHFKVLNDTLGHDAGDQVIKAFARTLINAVRMEDTVCRYGGEEFLF